MYMPIVSYECVLIAIAVFHSPVCPIRHWLTFVSRRVESHET